MVRQNHNAPSPARQQSARRWVATIRLLAACGAGLAVSCATKEEGGYADEANGLRSLASTRGLPVRHDADT